eukprot:NODE_3179_length_2079_cov_1.485143.p1 GENE.NODE_3179_length_2079_cov_1.485143~~NODE_3179_length_2079_cov_1.485143.p1  ORF type:complete len:678 (+),score=290.82 NODE_3179_length_2079_cov_1.485143:58-2034(+)
MIAQVPAVPLPMTRPAESALLASLAPPMMAPPSRLEQDDAVIGQEPAGMIVVPPPIRPPQAAEEGSPLMAQLRARILELEAGHATPGTPAVPNNALLMRIAELEEQETKVAQTLRAHVNELSIESSATTDQLLRRILELEQQVEQADPRVAQLQKQLAAAEQQRFAAEEAHLQQRDAHAQQVMRLEASMEATLKREQEKSATRSGDAVRSLEGRVADLEGRLEQAQGTAVNTQAEVERLRQVAEASESDKTRALEALAQERIRSEERLVTENQRLKKEFEEEQRHTQEAMHGERENAKMQVEEEQRRSMAALSAERQGMQVVLEEERRRWTAALDEARQSSQKEAGGDRDADLAEARTEAEEHRTTCLSLKEQLNLLNHHVASEETRHTQQHSRMQVPAEEERRRWTAALEEARRAAQKETNDLAAAKAERDDHRLASQNLMEEVATLRTAIDEAQTRELQLGKNARGLHPDFEEAKAELEEHRASSAGLKDQVATLTQHVATEESRRKDAEAMYWALDSKAAEMSKRLAASEGHVERVTRELSLEGAKRQAAEDQIANIIVQDSPMPPSPPRTCGSGGSAPNQWGVNFASPDGLTSINSDPTLQKSRSMETLPPGHNEARTGDSLNMNAEAPTDAAAPPSPQPAPLTSTRVRRRTAA